MGRQVVSWGGGLHLTNEVMVVARSLLRSVSDLSAGMIMLSWIWWCEWWWVLLVVTRMMLVLMQGQSWLRGVCWCGSGEGRRWIDLSEDFILEGKWFIVIEFFSFLFSFLFFFPFFFLFFSFFFFFTTNSKKKNEEKTSFIFFRRWI